MNQPFYTGKGIGVAILDTGIYPHIDFDSRICAFVDFILNKKIKKAEKRKVNCDLLHFAYIAMYTRNEYLVELYKSYWKNEVVDFDKISQEEKDLAQEIVMNSRIAVQKQNLFKISLGITEMALVLLLIKTVESLLRMVIS